MKRIEMVGASGVGKTTLYKKFDQLPADSRSFLTLKDVYKIAALNADISIFQPNLFFYQKLLRYGLLKSKDLGLSNVILKSKTKNDNDRNKYNDFRVSFDILYHSLKDSDNPFFVRKRIMKFLDTIDRHLLLEKYFSGDDVVIVEEGMLHYHPGISEYGFKSYRIDQLRNDPAFNPAGIIHCVQSAEVIFNQALKRKKQGKKTFSHGSLNNEELMVFVEKSIAAVDKKVKGKIKLGIPILRINTGETADQLIKKINEFSISLNA
jgi:hypothetical protein